MSTSSAIAPLKILFFGATGKVGFNVLKKGLLSAKYASKFQVTTPIRGSTLNSKDAGKQDKLTQLRGLGANLIDLDLASASHSALVSAIKANDILVSATSWSTPTEQSLALLAAAKEAGNLKLFAPSEFGMLYDECSVPFPIGIEGKLKLSAELSASGVPFARILTGVYYEFFFSPFGGYDLAKRTTILPGSSDSLITLMSEKDGAQLVAEVLLNYSAVYVRNQTVFLGGDSVSFGSMADLLEQKTGTKWSKSVNTSHELEQYIAQNPNSSFLQRWYLLFARQKAAHWNLQDGNTSFVHLHRKAKPDFQYKLLSVKEYILDHLKL